MYLTPPGGSSVVVNGTTYTAQSGQVLSVPDTDSAQLISAGWFVAKASSTQPGVFDTPLSIASSFTDGLTAYQCRLTTDYVFGTAATAGNLVTPIRNLTDLAVYFNAQADAVGTAVQNEEVERFVAFNSTNHAFNANDLSLTAALEGGGTFTVVTKVLVGAVAASATLTFADTTGINDGMMIASTGSSAILTGTYVASHTGTTVTLNGTVTLADTSPVQFLPCYVCPSVSSGTAQTTLTFASVPTSISAGMFYTNISNGTFGVVRVVSKTGTTVTVDTPVSPTAGNLVFFQPPVTSGQMWSKAGYQPGKNGANIIAMELTCTIPTASAQGAWPAWWMYSRSSEGLGFDASEIDMFEFFYGTTSNSSAYTSNIHGGFYNDSGGFYKRNSSGAGTNQWDSFGFFRPLIDFSLTQHKYQLIWTKDKVYRYVDNVLYISNKFLWSSNCTAQIGFDLACGSFLTPFLTTNFYPQTTGQFPFTFKLNEMKIWQA